MSSFDHNDDELFVWFNGVNDVESTTTEIYVNEAGESVSEDTTVIIPTPVEEVGQVGDEVDSAVFAD